MRIRLKDIYRVITYYMIFYVLNKNLFDLLSRGITKYLYYPIVALFGLLGLIKCIKTKYYRNITFSFVFYALFIIFNAFITFDKERFSIGIIEYITYPLVFFSLLFLFHGFENGEQINKLIYSLFCWSFITSILAVYEYLSRKPVLSIYGAYIYYFSDGTNAYRAGVFIGSPMVLAVILGMITVLIVYDFKVEQKNKFIILIIVNLMGIFATCSRGPLLFTIVSIGFLYFFLLWKNLLDRNTIFRLFVACFLLCILVCILFFGGVKTGISSIDTLIARFGSTLNVKEDGNNARLMIWKYYLGRFVEHPFIGHGVSATSNLVSNNLSHFNGYFTITVAESGVITRLVETGIIGFALYSVFLWNCLKIVVKKKNKNSCRKMKYSNILSICFVLIFVLEDIILQISTDMFANFIFFMLIVCVNQIESMDKFLPLKGNRKRLVFK